jgi:hypothetical protein
MELGQATAIFRSCFFCRLSHYHDIFSFRGYSAMTWHRAKDKLCPAAEVTRISAQEISRILTKMDSRKTRFSHSMNILSGVGWSDLASLVTDRQSILSTASRPCCLIHVTTRYYHKPWLFALAPIIVTITERGTRNREKRRACSMPTWAAF